MGRTVISVTEAITALGGTKAVANLLGSKQQAVSNWRRTGFPANTYVALSEALRHVGVEAPPSLWGMAEPRQAETPPLRPTSGKAA
ncbi:YdaS family helix-turn-helix protein [uncultured Methylobacterium sp.]|uniref:YdaS family helix-turn-helix protein n=1 Tax=uncultured Methylobacterium sp. TaxID=157278 RepID=UPI0035C9AE9D